jgi:hypothetical protein
MGRRRSSYLTAAVLGVVILAGVIALGVEAGLSKSGASPKAALAATGCTFTTAPSQGREHVTSLPKGFTYDTFPPTSGPHAPTPAIWGSYDRPVSELALVHNLEHGGIIVQYGDRVPSATVARIRAWYESSPDAIVVAPLPSLGGKVALSAWTHLATCSRFNAGAFGAFRDAYRFNGPEHLPLSALVPGT